MNQYHDGTHQMPFRQSSFVRTTAHIASSPLLPGADDPATALSLPLSPTTSASIPRSTIPKSIAWTARLSLWFLERRLAVRMSERIVRRMNARKEDEVVRGRRGKSVCNRLREESGNQRECISTGMLDVRDGCNDILIPKHY